MDSEDNKKYCFIVEFNLRKCSYKIQDSLSHCSFCTEQNGKFLKRPMRCIKILEMWHKLEFCCQGLGLNSPGLIWWLTVPEQSCQPACIYQVLSISFPQTEMSLNGALLSPNISIVLFLFFQNSKIKHTFHLQSSECMGTWFTCLINID